ncbi:MAG: hypothetical protein DRG20_03090 [Deltaproteobacteria bacterium]|nr:MAG: hypothetical protein DRG20_03090 [Deltaproteobacteria bacterium]
MILLKHLVNIRKIPELFEIEPRKGNILFGSGVIIARIVESSFIRSRFL